MRPRRVFFAAAVVVVVAAVTFVGGMRRKSRLVLDAVRRVSRAMKPLVLRSAGSAGASAAVVRHVGRVSGRPYETPVVAMPTDDGFVVALPYGGNTDWLKNVMAAGSATITHDGSEYTVDSPEVVPIDDVERFFAAKEQRAHRRFAVRDALRVRTAGKVARFEPHHPSSASVV